MGKSLHLSYRMLQKSKFAIYVFYEFHFLHFHAVAQAMFMR